MPGSLTIPQLNSRLAAEHQGGVLRVSDVTIGSHMAGPLFVAVEIPPNVDLEFDKVIFKGDHFFRQSYKGRLIFKDCEFHGSKVEFTKSKEGYVSFLGTIQLGFGISFDECDGISLSIEGDGCKFVIHPEWARPPGAPTGNLPKTVNIGVRRSSGGLTIRKFSTPLVLQIWDSKLAGLTVDADDLELFQVLKSEIETLLVTWREIGRWSFGRSEIGYVDVDFASVLSLPFVGAGILPKGIDGPSLDGLAQTYKRQGEMDHFVRMFARAGRAEVFFQIEKLKEKLARTGLSRFEFLKFKREHFALILRDLIVHKWFRRFYSIKPVLITQVLAIIFFGLVYYLFGELIITIKEGFPTSHSLSDSFYFSAVTFLTTDYGDLVPTECMRWIAVIEGFVGLSFSLLLAVVTSRRYS